MAFKQKILNIQAAIDKKKTLDLAALVQKRLDKTLYIYVQELEKSYDSLLQKDSLKVMNSLTKED